MLTCLIYQISLEQLNNICLSVVQMRTSHFFVHNILFFSFWNNFILSFILLNFMNFSFLCHKFSNSRIICFLTSSDTLICFTCWIIFKTMNTIIRQNLHFIFLRLFLNFISYSYPISDRFLIFFLLDILTKQLKVIERYY